MPRTSKLILIALAVAVGAMAVGIAVYHGKRLPTDVESILRATDQFELLSLYPYRRGGADESNEVTHFHGYRILGKTIVTDAEKRDEFISALNRGIEKSKGTMSAACFDPRHGIHAMHSGRTADVLICFDCGYLSIHVNGDDSPLMHFSSMEQPLFDDVLRRANVKLAPKH
jgi:hypothetical protein